MKRTLHWLSVLCLLPFIAQSQSTMEFQSGTNIDVGSGADICADNVIINGSYSGTGTVCITGSLPVEMVSMTADASRSDVTLNWTTATETNNFGFDIERRPILGGSQPAEWNKVGFVQGSGTSTSPTEYSFLDDHIPAGRYAYRIRQIDQSGSFTYTAATEVEVGLAPKEFTLSQNYPNPFNPTTTIEFTLQEDGPVVLKLYDATGQELVTLLDEERKAGYYQSVTFDASRFGSGTYFYRLQANGKLLTRKMVLVK